MPPRDRGDRPRLIGGGHERRDDLPRRSWLTAVAIATMTEVTSAMTARTAVPAPDCLGR